MRCWAVWCLVVGVALGGVPARADLEEQTRQILRGANLRGTQVSAMLVDLVADHTRVALHPDRPMIPASNMKLLTTAAALHQLGTEFVFVTDLELLPAEPLADAAGDPNRSLALPLPPDLRVVGSGDPALGDDALLAELGLEPDAVLDRFVESAVRTGFKRFGVLYLDDDVFDATRVHPTWPTDQLDKWYCAEVAGLNFHGNVLDILYVPGLPGAAPTVQVYPWSPTLRTVNRAVTANRDAFWIERDPAENAFTFGGQVRNARRVPLRTTLHDPAMYFGQLLRHRLAEVGVTVERVQRWPSERRPRAGEVLFRIQTTLPGILDRTNQDSSNLFAEALFKAIGHDLTGSPGSFENGAAAVRVYLQERLSGRIAVPLVKPVDGSGLSRENRATARTFVEVLRDMHERPELRDVFRDSLAAAGENGTLRRRGEGLGGAQVFAKSGFIRGVSALSGYLVVPDAIAPQGRRTAAFSLLFNGFGPPLSNRTIKDVQDQLLEAYAARLLAEAR